MKKFYSQQKKIQQLYYLFNLQLFYLLQKVHYVWNLFNVGLC